MRFLLRKLLIALPILLCGIGSTITREQQKEVPSPRIIKGLAFDGTLWLLAATRESNHVTGALISIDLRNETLKIPIADGVVDITGDEHSLLALRGSPEDPKHFYVSVWQKNRFENLPSFAVSDEDMPIALLNRSSTPIVLCKRTVQLLSTDRSTWREVKLSGQLRFGMQVAVALPVNGGPIYIGLNVGEFGGGVQAVDLRTGIVKEIERRDTKELCAGPLNRDCSPVTSVIADPANKDCVLAAVGLLHLDLTEGKVLRLCGENVSLVWEKPVKTDTESRFGMTEAVFGLAPGENGSYWVITWRAVYQISPGGTKELKLPPLKPVSGIYRKHKIAVYLSRELPRVIVVRTDVNWAVSTSGYTPLIVPLDNSN